ncbi:MAG: hypothetical protein VX619_03530 [bacterium]|nr:hypothetical protein [bacterium]
MKTGSSAKIALLTMINFTISISSLETFDWNKIRNSAKKISKSSGIAAVIRKVATELNNFINTITLNQGIQNRQMTRVVHLFSVGTRTTAGGVHCVGVSALVDYYVR